MKIVRFKGKFTDLIPNGWTFQKLFGCNYRQYHKTTTGEKHGQGCRIWQHRGGYLEIDDLYSEMSAVFVQQIIDGKIDEWRSEMPNVFHTGKTVIQYQFFIDQTEKKFVASGTKEYSILNRERFNLDPDINKEAFHAFCDRYRSWHAKPELVEMLKDLVHRGWIAVEDVSDNPKWNS